MTQTPSSVDWIDPLLERIGQLYQDYLDEASIYDGASWGGKKVDEIKQAIQQHINQVEVEARRNEVGLIDMGDVEYPRKRLEQLTAPKQSYKDDYEYDNVNDTPAESRAKEARINELERHIEQERGVAGAIHMSRIDVDDRIKTLQQDRGISEDT